MIYINIGLKTCFSQLRQYLRTSKFLYTAFILFLAGFFLAPENSLHRDFYYLFVLLPFLVSVRVTEIQELLRNKLFLFSFVFLTYLLLSMVWSNHSQINDFSDYYDKVKYYFLILSVILISAHLAKRYPEIVKSASPWIGSAASISALISIIRFYNIHTFPDTRLVGAFDYIDDNPIMAALYFGCVGLINFYSFRSASRLWEKTYSFLCFLIAGIFMILTQSRGPLLAFIISLVAGLFFEKRWTNIFVLIIVWLTILAFIETYDIGIMGFLERGTSYRVELWLLSLNSILPDLLFGKGYFVDINLVMSDGMVFGSPHNLLLLIMMQCGIVGGGMLLALIGSSLVAAYKYFIISGTWIFLLFLIFFLVAMSVDTVYLIHKPSISWFMFWIPIGFLGACTLKRRTKPYDD